MDQSTKYWIAQNMHLGQSINLIGKFVRFTYVLNPNAAFGIGIGDKRIHLAITIVAVIAIFVYYFQLNHKGTFMVICLGSILGGAFGNLTDRIKIGKVVDFIDIGKWPVFNVADIGVTVGVLGLILILFNEEKKKEKETIKHDGTAINSRSNDG